MVGQWARWPSDLTDPCYVVAMTYRDAMAALKSYGTVQNHKVYARRVTK